MKNHFFNGEYWYEDSRPILKRFRQWLIWIGGWETADGKWSLFWKYGLRSPAPLSMFGHRFTYYSWGCDFRFADGWLVWTFDLGRCGSQKVYFSPDGTPDSATAWFLGTPEEVIAASKKRQASLNLLDAQYLERREVGERHAEGVE